jgi:tetratricopeptide (TPR) repeat protein
MWMVTAVMLVAGSAGTAGEVEDALALEREGRDGDALAAMDQLVRRSPAWELPRLEAARLRMKLGRELDRAVFDADVARSLTPENPRAHYLFALISEERGQEAEAVRAYETALALRPTYDEARFRIAGIYFARGDWALAEEHYRALSAEDPAASSARLQWIATLERQGRDEDAEQELVRIRRADPGSIAVARRLAALYERTGRPGLARKILASVEAPREEEAKKMRPLRKSRR